MSRITLTDVLDNIDTTDTGENTARTEPTPSPVRSVPSTPRGPRYLQLDRKDLRIRGDQADELSALTRQLNRSRNGTGERITDNTLIRVAIDLLLRQRDRLAGVTEAELTTSVIPD
jgi:hypothetical protein